MIFFLSTRLSVTEKYMLKIPNMILGLYISSLISSSFLYIEVMLSRVYIYNWDIYIHIYVCIYMYIYTCICLFEPFIIIKSFYCLC